MTPADAEGPAPHFSEPHRAWVISRPADIRAVLRDRRFGHLGAAVGVEAPHAEFLSAMVEQPHRWWTSPESAALLRPEEPVLESFAVHLEHLIDGQAARATSGVPVTVDLMAVVIRPWCHHVTSVLLDLPIAVVNESEPLTRLVFDAAALMNPASVADSTVRTGRANAVGQATQELLRRLAPFRTSRRPTDGLDIQAWVALTQSLPALIGAGVLRLHPSGMENGCPFSAFPLEGGDRPAAIDTLVAMASPVRAIFRTALQEATVANVVIAPGDRVMLHVEGHREFVFGDGLHRCAGASLVRALFMKAMQVLLLEAPCMVMPDHNGEYATWAEGVAMRTLRTLPGKVHRRL